MRLLSAIIASPTTLYRGGRSRGNGKLAAQRAYFAPNALVSGGIVGILQRVEYPAANPPHLVSAHAARGQRWRADANAAGIERLARVERNHVHVHRDSASLECLGRQLAANIERCDIDEH